MLSGAIRRMAVPLFVATALPARLASQTDPRLAAAVRQAQEGQSDSARAAVQQLLTKTPASDALYPQILYTAGIIASDAGEMRRKFQQVVVEFPLSPWTDDALVRLAQVDYASRELDAAARSFERLATDFPDSDLFPQAAYWAGRSYFDLGKPAEACRWLADGMARSRDNVEIQNQLGFLYQRCDVAATPADTTPSQAPPPKPDSATPPAQPAQPSQPVTIPPPAPASPARPSAPAKGAPKSATGSHYRVQIAAVGTSAAAEAAARKAQALGHRTVTVRESGLYKVRAGDFPTRADAQQAAASLQAKLGGNPFVVSGE